jgi:hypothetical protein
MISYRGLSVKIFLCNTYISVEPPNCCPSHGCCRVPGQTAAAPGRCVWNAKQACARNVVPSHASWVTMHAVLRVSCPSFRIENANAPWRYFHPSSKPPFAQKASLRTFCCLACCPAKMPSVVPGSTRSVKPSTIVFADCSLRSASVINIILPSNGPRFRAAVDTTKL